MTQSKRYRAGSKQRRLALRIHGRITPDEARKLARQRAGEVAPDHDPAAERRAGK